MSGRLLAGEPYCAAYTLNRGKGLLSRQRSSLPESLCSAGGHWWEVQRRGTLGATGSWLPWRAAAVADISVSQADHTGGIGPPLDSGSQGIP